MNFVKMHGIGNDYVYIDRFKEKRFFDFPKLAQEMSHRHFGVGSDGLILIEPHSTCDAEMIMYNADGSSSEMCGNGLRCVAKYIHDHYFFDKDTLKIQTNAGILQAKVFKSPDHKADLIEIDMGSPIFEGSQIPTTFNEEKVFEKIITIDEKHYTFYALSMGNPHCVIFVDSVKTFPVEKIGPVIENHPFFPSKTNVEFVEIISPTEVKQRTWERGSGETWACGTGASAVGVVCYLTKKTESKIKVHLLGGTLEINYDLKTGIKMKGHAVEVFRGTW